eukprot:4389925-Amphidinium_carterae.1
MAKRTQGATGCSAETLFADAEAEARLYEAGGGGGSSLPLSAPFPSPLARFGSGVAPVCAPSWGL